jgi:ubiquinone/menaquinone biosynthesis C-methylase UbiE
MAANPQIEAKVRAEWLDDATCAAWRRWHDKSVHFWRELNQALLAHVALAPGQRVLDLAGGTGDPGLEIARLVAPGEVTITDFAPQMVEIARGFAARDGVANVTCATADAHALPFPDSSFDRVTCRLGIMFFWDTAKALAEIRRVLRPGGRAVFVVWGPPEQNEFIRLVLGPFKKRRPPPGAPQQFSYAAAGKLGGELRAAGFQNVVEEARTVRIAWPGPPEELWRRQHEVSAPMRPYFNSFSEAERAECVAEVVAGLQTRYDGKEISACAPIIVGVGGK